MQAAQAMEIRNPGPLKSVGTVQLIFAACAVIGVAVFALGLTQNPERAWFSYLHNHFYFMSLALGGIFFAAVQWATSAMWSAPVRRIAESFTAYLPIAILTFIGLYFGLSKIYIWTNHAVVHGDIVLEGKKGYLSVPFFMIRNLIALGLMYGLTRKLIGRSIQQDSDRNAAHTLKNRILSPAFLLVFAVGFTMMSFDQLMSLDPHWFSTMFGVYCFAGLFYSVLALTTVVTVLLRRQGALAGIVNDNHLHDLGKFMFAFTVFWAYIGFSQYMLIWYANMPEETPYFIHRLSGGWMKVSAFLLFGKFMVPFFFLLPREAKRNETRLLTVGIFMLIAQWIDMLWLTQPESVLGHEGPVIGVQEIGTMLGFLGLFGLTTLRFLTRHNVVAIGDPRLVESVTHHHQ